MRFEDSPITSPHTTYRCSDRVQMYFVCNMSSTFRRPDPLSLNRNVAENWRLWKQRFNIYLLASDAVGKRDAVKIDMLLNFVGEDAPERYNQFS